jgi:HNH endonuclease/NUMOD4 motif
MPKRKYTREIWKPITIQFFRNFYDISSIGKVRRLVGGTGTFVGKILKPFSQSTGYLRVWLYANCKRQEFLVHKLVAEAFLGPRPKGKEINHKNGIKTDNRAENLEYVTRGENVRHAFRLGLYSQEPPHYRGEDHPRHRITEKRVNLIRSLWPTVSQRALARRFGVSQRTVLDILKWRTWTHI